ncbi:MAG: hypothetical protein ACYDG2_13350 [Ruminiclostridium sp.]
MIMIAKLNCTYQVYDLGMSKVNNNLIVFYISSHGFDHMTRCLAIMQEILQKADDSIYIVSGKFQNDFARTYLIRYINRIIFNDINTDIGLINISNSLRVDTKRLESELYSFITSWENVVNKECEFLRNFNLKYIISDISPLGSLVAEKLNIQSFGIQILHGLNNMKI